MWRRRDAIHQSDDTRSVALPTLALVSDHPDVLAVTD